MTENRKDPTFLLMLSAAFEYYDFVIYAMMASYLGPLFFPSSSDLVSQLQAFSVFALGYIARPLGGIIFGMLGDLTSRKAIFIRTNLILAIATIAISILPNYNQIGITATIGIILLRITQSLTFAAELSGAMSIIKDGAKAPAKSFSFVVSGAALGSILASLVLYLLELNFSKAEILAFAWRIPFIFGAVLCLIGIIMRSKLTEVAREKAKDKLSLLAIMLPEYKNIVSFVSIISLSAYLIIMNLFFPSFLPKFYNYPIKQVYLAISLSLLWAVIYAPIFAHLTHKMAKLTLLQIIIVAGIFLGLIVNFLLLRGGFIHLLVGLCIYQAIISSLMVVTFPLMAEVFPSQARFTLMAACYNITYMIMSFSPVLVTKLASSWQTPFSLWLGFILLSIFALKNTSSLAEE